MSTATVNLDERGRALVRREQYFQSILQNADQGFLMLSREGLLFQEHSSIVERWFGPFEPNTSFVAYVTPIDAQFAELFELAHAALVEEVLPRELCIHQLPRRLKHRGSEFRCHYMAAGDATATPELFIVIKDITAELKAARQEAEGGEFLALFEAFSHDRAGLSAFVTETSEQLANLPDAPIDAQKRLIHTIKGNCSLMGMSVVADLCHDLEGHIVERHMAADSSTLAALQERWQELARALETFGTVKTRAVLELSLEEVERLEQDLEVGVPAAHIRERLASWRLEPAERPLSHLGCHARKLAARLGKGDLNVEIDAGEVQLAPPVWATIWSDLAHVVRNAIDHGIETPSIRRLAGKPARPQLRLTTKLHGGHLIIEVADDGAGIDWPAVKRAAMQRGLAHETEADLVNAIFAPDVTTRGEVTVTSGRGMGLAAVRQQVAVAGGSIDVTSTWGAGTIFRFTIPMPSTGMPAGAVAADLRSLAGEVAW